MQRINEQVILSTRDQEIAELQFEALALITEVAWAFDRETKTKGKQGGVIGTMGREVFRSLAKLQGVFMRPVPFRRDTIMKATSCSRSAFGPAFRRLESHGFVEVSGPRTAPMVILRLPSAAIEAYERELQKWKDERAMPTLGLEAAIRLLDEDRPEPLI